eukprot:COSAG06_NODE_530_length_14570_cov_23.269435_6_plen_104_part_00
MGHCEWRRPQSLTPHDGWGRALRPSQQVHGLPAWCRFFLLSRRGVICQDRLGTRNIRQNRNIKRPGFVCSQGQWSVFNGEPRPSDVEQGRLGAENGTFCAIYI